MRRDIHELELDVAFESLSNRMARDPYWRNTYHPSHYTTCWNAYVDYLKRKAQVVPYTGKKHRRGTGDQVHVSFVSNDVGYNCDRALGYAITRQPQEPSTVVSEEYRSLVGALERCFWYGHGAEDEIYRLFGMALDQHYGEDLVVHEIVYERPIFTDPPAVCAGDEKVLSGTCDIWIRYSYKGEPIVTAVWDVKTISVTRSAAQTPSPKKETKLIAAGGRAGEPNAQKNYQRQVNSYLEPCQADTGGLLYWEKQWTHQLHQFVVDRRPGLYAANIERIKEVREDVEEGRLPPANRSKTWCNECSYQRACAQDDLDYANAD